jgi:hypothetical protein
MPEQHVVEQGEHTSSIAEQHGFRDYRSVWEDQQNAGLRTQRQNPNVLLPGDVVAIPDKRERREPAQSGQRHVFRLRGRKLELRLRLCDAGGRPLADAPCELRVDGEKSTLATDGDGRLKLEIPRTARDAVLTVDHPDSPFDVETPIHIGHLDPVDAQSGQAARLRNLGYYYGDVENVDPEGLRSAVEEFQCDQGLSVDGVCGTDTQERLKQVHGC